MIGTSVCILRSVLQTPTSLVCWFAPVRATRYHAARTILGEQLVDHSSPDKDIRLEINSAERSAELLLLCGSLAKMERSPLFLIDSGVDGTSPRIIQYADLGNFVAGSMGLVVPVRIQADLMASLNSMVVTQDDVIDKISNIAAAIFQAWPQELRALRPQNDPFGWATPQSDQAGILAIAADLIRISHLINGAFPTGFGRVNRADLQLLASFGGFHSIRLRDLTLEEIANPSGVFFLIRTLVQMLADKTFPIWSVWFLEDLFTPLVQELIRYIPQLFHLRSSKQYGNHKDLAHPLIVLRDPVVTLEPQFKARLAERYLLVIGDLQMYDQPRSFCESEKLAVRNLVHNLPADDRSDIINRPDLSLTVIDMAHWERDLMAYIMNMSFMHDQGRVPHQHLIKHIIDQFWDPLTQEFASGAQGLARPIQFVTIDRPAA